MSTVRESIKEKNPFRRGADNGFAMGLVLIVLFFAMTMGYKSTLASWMSLAIIFIVVPVMTFVYLRRSYDKDNRLTVYSSLWMQGIVMFFCGTLILALFQYVYLRFMNPTFIVNTFARVADIYSSMGTPQGADIARTLHNMINRHMLPSPIHLSISTIWLGVFTGSLLSAVMAGVVKMSYKTAK